jgi:hypothetical protein
MTESPFRTGIDAAYGSCVRSPHLDDLPSLSLVLDVLRVGREERRAHFDALDQKAGLAIGSAGVLVTLSNDIVEPWRALGVVASVISAALALSSFWPRRYEVLDNLRDYLATPEAQTKVVLVDTLALVNLRADGLMGAKARRLKAALLALALAVVMLGVGVVWNSGGSNGGKAHRSSGTAATPAAASAGP